MQIELQPGNRAHGLARAENVQTFSRPIFRFPLTRFPDLDQLDIGMKDSVGRNHISTAFSAVGKMGADDEPPVTANPHSLNAFADAGHLIPLSEIDDDCPVLQVFSKDLLAAAEEKPELDHDGQAPFGNPSGAGYDVLDFHPLWHGTMFGTAGAYVEKKREEAD
jgi:hypothetical protein